MSLDTKTTAELVFEARIEEIPAGAQQDAARQFRNGFAERINEEFGELPNLALHADCGPRRLWLTASGLPTVRPMRRIESRGPREGAPEMALAGFARSQGAAIEDCELRDTPKGAFWFLTRDEGGGAVADWLSESLLSTLRAIKWPTSMVWAGPDVSFTRPIRGLLGVFDGQTLKGELALNSESCLPFSDTTFGHRIHGADVSTDGETQPRAIVVSTADDYHSGLRAAGVLTSHAERKEIIEARLKTLCDAANYRLEADSALLDEVAGLCEWPVPFLGNIDTHFLELPEEVLITSMKTHQKFFAVRDQHGALAPVFAAVANLEAEDGGAAIRLGAQRVLRARLSDAEFFWAQDQARGLADMAASLSAVTFYAKLGTLAERVQRIQALAQRFSGLVGTDAAPVDPKAASTAASLCKADLVSTLVGEFPELQGVIGKHLAQAEGYGKDVAQAIAEHYHPAGPSGHCPSAPTSIALCLAERVELLSGFFSIGEPPTGSRDPFALRRAALGLIRLILENTLTVALEELFADMSENSIRISIVEFILDRFKIRLKSEGVEAELLRAVLTAKSDATSEGTDLCRIAERIKVLQDFLRSDSGANLLTAYRRAQSILAQEGATQEAGAATISPDMNALVQCEEQELAARCAETETNMAKALNAQTETGDRKALEALSMLRAPVDAFFDHVTVNDPEHRGNRLALLAHLTGLFDRFADFSLIPGDWEAR